MSYLLRWWEIWLSHHYLLNQFSYLLNVNSLPAMLVVSSVELLRTPSLRSWAPVGTTSMCSCVASSSPLECSLSLGLGGHAAKSPPCSSPPLPPPCLTASLPGRKENEKEEKMEGGGTEGEWQIFSQVKNIHLTNSFAFQLILNWGGEGGVFIDTLPALHAKL